MDEEKKLEAATQLRQLANQNLQNRNLFDAFFYYLNCLKILPSWKEDLKQEFLIALSLLGQIFEKKRNYSELFTAYKEALAIYDDSEEVYHNLGAHLLRLGHPDSATHYFKEALHRNENYFPAFRSLHSTYCLLVERWHYRMLNDFVRNNAYKDAIHRKILQGFDEALDIGTGTGIFCLYAVEAGVRKIYACDYNPVMLSIASKVFEKNNVEKKIRLINKHSNDLLVPIDIAERVSLVITETMDSCILGEHMLQSLKYAWEHLLLPPYQFDENNFISNIHSNGIVIPFSGRLWFVAVQSRILAKNYMFPLPCTDPDVFTNAFASFSLKETPESFRYLNLSVRLCASLNDPYDTARLQLLPDCKFLTAPQELFCINFNDPEEIDKCLRDGKEGNEISFDVTCNQSGYFHFIAAWFEVQLDENISICSAPDDVNAKNCCWDQAIFPNRNAYNTVPGSKLRILADWSHGKVSFNMKQISHPCGDILNHELLPDIVPSAFISMMNDSNLITHLMDAAFNFTQIYVTNGSLRIIDLYPVPIFGLSLLCNIHIMKSPLSVVEMISIINSREEKELICKIARCNGIPLTNLSFINEQDFEEKLMHLPEKYFDTIAINLIDADGDLSECAISRINLLKPLLKTGGVILPHKIEIVGQLIHSEYIEKNMRILNDDILKRGIGDCLNEFEVSQMLEVNIAMLPFDVHSTPFLCHEFCIFDLDTNFSKQFNVAVTQRGMINSVLYWYHLNSSDNESGYSTFNEFSYVHQAAFLTKRSVAVLSHLPVQFVYHHGTFIINPKICDINN